MSDSTLRVLNIPARRHKGEDGHMYLDLDPVTAFMEDFEPGRGQLTLVCWGRAWTHFWGAMGNGSSLRDFLLSASTGYIVGKLMLTRDVLLKRAEPREGKWLTQIVQAMKDTLRAEAASPIASRTVVSSPGAAIRVEALELTEAGREMLTVKEKT